MESFKVSRTEIDLKRGKFWGEEAHVIRLALNEVVFMFVLLFTMSLFCQHPRHPVRVMWGANSAEAQVNFRSASDQPFDLAVITVGGNGPLRALKISSIQPRTGKPILLKNF